MGPFTNSVTCPECQAQLEVTSGSRILSSWAGLAVGWAVWEVTKETGGSLNFVLPELYAVLAFGITSAFVVMFTAELRVAPAAPVAIPAPAAGHGAHH